MSAIDRVLEQRLEYVGLFVYREAESDSRYWTEATIEALDAALEYWLLVLALDGCVDCGVESAMLVWDDKEGWICDCLDK